MHFKIAAGAEIETLTPHEAKGILSSWLGEITRGIKFRVFDSSTLAAAGAFIIDQENQPQAPNGASSADDLGPAPGFVWAVLYVAVSGPGFTLGTDKYSVYNSRVTPARLVSPNNLLDKQWNVPGLVLNGGESVAVSGVATGGGGTAQVTVSGAAAELPKELAWQFLG